MQLNRGTLEWYELLSRGLVWAAGIVLLLSIVGAVVITGTNGALPFLAEAERQGRGVLALASLGGGVTSAAILAGVGAILRLMVADRMAQLPIESDRVGDEPDPLPAKTKREPAKPKPKPKPKPKRERAQAEHEPAKPKREPVKRRATKLEKPDPGAEE